MQGVREEQFVRRALGCGCFLRQMIPSTDVDSIEDVFSVGRVGG